jgi:hypothetical protein
MDATSPLADHVNCNAQPLLHNGATSDGSIFMTRSFARAVLAHIAMCAAAACATAPAATRFQRPVLDVARASLPMLGVLAIGVLLITLIPQLTLALPRWFAGLGGP